MFTRDDLETLKEYAGWIIASFLPGFFVMELIYHKGLSSGGIKNIFDLILFLVWSFFISHVFNIINMNTVRLDKIESIRGQLDTPIASYLLLPPLIFFTLITFIIYQIFYCTKLFEPGGILCIPPIHIRLVLSFIIAIPISFIVGPLWREGILKRDRYYNIMLQEKIEKYSEARAEDKKPEELLITKEDVRRELHMIPDLTEEDIKNNSENAYYWFIQYGVLYPSQLKELVRNKKVLKTLRKIYRKELLRPKEHPIDSIAVSVWGSILFNDGINSVTISEIEKYLRQSPEYLKMHKK